LSKQRGRQYARHDAYFFAVLEIRSSSMKAKEKKPGTVPYEEVDFLSSV